MYFIYIYLIMNHKTKITLRNIFTIKNIYISNYPLLVVHLYVYKMQYTTKWL